ncbi:AraC family transcriptional regulator [Lachnospiraceae bacterium JLR.KK008]
MEKAYKLEFESEKTDGFFLNCCGCSKTEPLHSFGPALKPHFLIHYVLSGRGRFSIRNQTYRLKKGSGFLIVPGELVFYEADETEPWTYLWVGFSGSQAEDYVKKMGLSEKHPVFYSDKKEELYACVHNMMEHNTWSVSNNLRRNGELAVFLSVIASQLQIRETDDADRANTYVKKAVAFIQSNYYNPIKVTDIADFVCVNRSYLCTLFESSIGMPPQRFLAAYRLTKAAQLLQTTDIPIESIALSCGYGDAFVFTKAFKRLKGLSPSVYRKEFRSEGDRNDKEELIQIEDFIRQLDKEADHIKI